MYSISLYNEISLNGLLYCITGNWHEENTCNFHTLLAIREFFLADFLIFTLKD